MTPDAAIICPGAIQRLAVTLPNTEQLSIRSIKIGCLYEDYFSQFHLHESKSAVDSQDICRIFKCKRYWLEDLIEKS